MSEDVPINNSLLDQSKSTVKASKDIPIIDPKIQVNITGFLPNLSLQSPIDGDDINCAKEYVQPI